MFACDVSNWVQIFASLLTLFIAIAVAIIAFFQWKTNDLKRKNDLFDRRYEFYQSLRKWWLLTKYENNSVDIEDLIPFAEEAGFLFGDDIVNHILSLKGKVHSGSPDFPDSDFSSPFREYLKLK